MTWMHNTARPVFSAVASALRLTNEAPLTLSFFSSTLPSPPRPALRGNPTREVSLYTFPTPLATNKPQEERGSTKLLFPLRIWLKSAQIASFMTVVSYRRDLPANRTLIE